MAGARALLPDPAAFGAAAEAEAKDDQAQNRGDALMHGASLAHRARRREGRLFIPPPRCGAAAETLNQAVADAPPGEHESSPKRRNGSGGGGGHHPFVEGLLETLPDPGTLWTIEGRAAWPEAAANIFTLMYKGEGRIAVQAIPPQRKEKVG